MKYVVMNGNVVQDILYNNNPTFPDMPIERRFPASYLTSCIKVSDETKVQIGFKYVNGEFEPVVAPEPAPITLEQIKAEKIKSLSGSCSSSIISGVDVNGKHYGLSDRAQANIDRMSALAIKGQATFLYSADNENMSEFTADEINEIAQVKDAWVMANTAYYGQLKKWINRETDAEEIEAIQYGSKLPDDLINELTSAFSRRLNVEIHQ